MTVDKPAPETARPQAPEDPAPKTLFGGQFAGAIFWLAAAMIAILFLVSIVFLVKFTWPGNNAMDSMFFLFVFLLLLSLALFLSLFAGERYNITIAGMTFVGSAAVLAALLWLFNHFFEEFSTTVIGRIAPETATLQFRCDAVESKEQSLIMFVKGDDKYIDWLEPRVNKDAHRSFIRIGNSQLPVFSRHHLLLMNRGDDKFSIPVDFGFEHTLTVIPVSPAIDKALRSEGPAGQVDVGIEVDEGDLSPLLKLQMDMNRNSDSRRITAIFDLNVASDYCRPRSEKAEGGGSVSSLGAGEQ